MNANGQHSLTNPLVCHDKDNYLRCYNDDNYRLTFANGNFKEFKAIDNSISYSEADKTITFLHKKFVGANADTIQILQQPKSILLKKGSSSLEITSLKDVPKGIEAYGVSPYLVHGAVMGFDFWAGERYVQIEVSTYWKTWSWTIILKTHSERFVIVYNGYKNNRVGYIFIVDDSLRYGVSISTTFKTLKKLSKLESCYVDSVGVLANGTIVMGSIPLDKYYKYEYDKKGKLKTGNIVGELRLCDCK